MLSKPSPLQLARAILISAIPFIIGLFCEMILLHLGPSVHGFHQEYGMTKDSLNLLFLWIKEIVYGVYSSFLGFLSAMILIHFLRFLANLKKQTQNLKSSAKLSFVSFLRSVILYSIIYSCICLTVQDRASSIRKEGSSLKHLQEGIIHDSFTNSRILAHEEEEAIRYSQKNSISFSMGRLLGSLNIIDASSIILSKDEKTLYVGTTDDVSMTLSFKVVDVSNKENPMLMKTVTITQGALIKPTLSLILSHDEKTLYACNQQYFSSYHVSNLESVTELLTIKIPKFAEAFRDRQLDIPRVFSPFRRWQHVICLWLRTPSP